MFGLFNRHPRRKLAFTTVFDSLYLIHWMRILLFNCMISKVDGTRVHYEERLASYLSCLLATLVVTPGEHLAFDIWLLFLPVAISTKTITQCFLPVSLSVTFSSFPNYLILTFFFAPIFLLRPPRPRSFLHHSGISECCAALCLAARYWCADQSVHQHVSLAVYPGPEEVPLSYQWWVFCSSFALLFFYSFYLFIIHEAFVCADGFKYS